MANLIVVCGPQAVGKMVVAESLRDKLNTDEGETWFKNHLKIDNTNLTSDEVVAFSLVCMLQV